MGVRGGEWGIGLVCDLWGEEGEWILGGMGLGVRVQSAKDPLPGILLWTRIVLCKHYQLILYMKFLSAL